jgi:hypothetical protein
MTNDERRYAWHVLPVTGTGSLARTSPPWTSRRRTVATSSSALGTTPRGDDGTRLARAHALLASDPATAALPDT